MGGWIGLVAVLLLGARRGRYTKEGAISAHPPSSIPFLALGAWILTVVLFTLTQNRWKIDDVLGVWPLHGMCGAWGGIAAGIFGSKALGGMGGVAFGSQLAGTVLAIVIAAAGAALVYGALKAMTGLRLDAEEEFNGADLTIHKITATPEREPSW
jgi:Amt family ammonium transporter